MKRTKYGYRIVRGLLTGALLFAVSGMISPVWADGAKDSAQLVDKARMTLENFVKAQEMEAFRNLLKDARGVFIAPQILKGAFVVGVSGGSGVFVVRDRKGGTWAGPAFYTILTIDNYSSTFLHLVSFTRSVDATPTRATPKQTRKAVLYAWRG